MKKSARVSALVALSLIVMSGIMMFSGCGKSSSSTPAAGPAYSGTVYMAGGPGGHIGSYPVTIDPSNTSDPITVDVATVKRIQILGAPGSTGSLMFHDVRFGVNTDGTTNYNRIYYSGMMSLASNTLVVPIGYVDMTGTLTGNNVGKNSTIDIDFTATGPFTNGMDTIAFALSNLSGQEFGVPGGNSAGTRINYCGSGMNKTHYFAMSMSFPAYVDAIPVGKLDTVNSHLVKTTDFKRTYIGQLDDAMNLSLHTSVVGTVNLQGGGTLPLNLLGVPPLAFIHGATSPDGTKVYLSTNQMADLNNLVGTAGNLRAYIVNASDLAAGGMTPSQVVAKNIAITVGKSVNATDDHNLQGTIAYRASYTPDGTHILQSGSDRLIILNASDLSLFVDTAGSSASPSGASAPKAAAIATGLGAGTFGGIEVHDVTATADSKYAIVAVRYYADGDQVGAGIKSSGVQLYDINNKAFIGKVAPTCGSSALGCHAANGDAKTRPTCGIIPKWN